MKHVPAIVRHLINFEYDDAPMMHNAYTRLMCLER